MSAVILLTTIGAALGLLAMLRVRRGEGEAAQRCAQPVPIPVVVEHEPHTNSR